MRDLSAMNGSDAASRPREIALAQEKPFRLAETQVRPAALEVEIGADITSLEPRVMKVLVALARLNGEPVSREQLIEWCWGGRVVTDGALNRSIAQLRKALRDPGIRIDTIPRVGYRLQAARPSTVSPLPAVSASTMAADEGQAASVADTAVPSVAQGKGSADARSLSRVLSRRSIQIGALVVAVVALVVIGWRLPGPGRAAVIWTASGFRPLTSTAEQETFPALSPEGTQIVYSARPNAYGQRDLYLRNVNEGTPVRLTSDPSDEYGAAWSPDGSRIAFARSVDGEPCAIVVMPIPSGSQRVVARCEGGAETRPSWLDSRRLVYSDPSTAQSVPRVRVVDIDTGVVSNLTSPSARTLGDTDPQAAPDGRRIAFRRTLMTGADDLLVLDTQTGREHAVTTDGWKAAGYVWSSDSRYIFFSSNRGGEFGLWSVDERGRTPPREASLGLGAISFTHISADKDNRVAVEITRAHSKVARVSRSGSIELLMAGAGSDGEPAVAGDGAIAHVSNRGGTYEMWLSEGSAAPVRLTSIGGSYILDPSWSADATQVAFVGVKGRTAEIYTVGRDGTRLQQRTNDAVAKKFPVFAGRELLYLERDERGWRLMELDLDGRSPPRALPGGDGWAGLRPGPDGTVFGRRAGEGSVRRVSPFVQSGSAPPSSAFAPVMSLDLTDNDTWAVGTDGIYVRRARRIDRSSAIWFFPWNGAQQRIADVPLAYGNISVGPEGDVLVSQATSDDMDLAIVELKPLP